MRRETDRQRQRGGGGSGKQKKADGETANMTKPNCVICYTSTDTG